MTGTDRGTTASPAERMPGLLYLLLSFAMLFYGGCTQGPAPLSRVETAPVTKTEADLLAELDKRFENPDAHCQLGSLYQASKEWAKAEYHYNIALGFDPAHRPAQAAMVKLQMDRGNTVRAEQYASNYIKQAAVSAKESLLLGEEYDKRGLGEYALTCVKQALSMAPNSPQAYKDLGFHYLNAGEKSRAKDHLTRSFELNPNQPDVAGALGRLGVVVSVPAEGRTAPAEPQKEMKGKK